MKIIDKIKKYISAFFFGLKAGDGLLTSSDKNIDEGSTITQKSERKGVLNDLLKGEVTQEVEELRYETFKAEELSNDYQYIGNGRAIKKSGNSENKRKNFYQYNMHQEYSFQETMKMIENENFALSDKLPERKIFNIEYNNPCVRFKFENYIEKVKVDIIGETPKTYIYFTDDTKDKKMKPFMNALKKTIDELERVKKEGSEFKLKSYTSRNEILSEIKSLSFKTFKATNDVPNGIDYNFTGPRFEDIYSKDGSIVLLFSWKEFDGNVLLSEKFKSESAEKKFKNKERRENYRPVVDFESLSHDTNEIETRERDRENIEEWINSENLDIAK